MIGHIYINGQIGTFDGIKGVELQDVISQYEPMKDYERVEVHINSCGGLVTTGTAIHNYLGAFKNIYTIAEKNCMSIATKIHLSVPVENRFIQKGCEYMVHAPLITNIGGNSDELQEIADGLKDLENDLVSTYVKATGTSKEGIQAIVKQETSLTDEQAISLGFASKIIEPTILRAVAFIESNSINKKNTLMSEFMDKLIASAKNIAVNLGLKEEDFAPTNNGREAVAMQIVTDKGTLDTMYSDVMVGDEAMIDGAVAPDGDYTAEDGTVFTVVAGVITAIVPPVEAEMVAMADFKALEVKVAELEAKNVELKNENDQALEVLNKIEKAKASTHVVNAVAYVGATRKKVETTERLSYSERMAQRVNNAKLK